MVFEQKWWGIKAPPKADQPLTEKTKRKTKKVKTPPKADQPMAEKIKGKILCLSPKRRTQ